LFTRPPHPTMPDIPSALVGFATRLDLEARLAPFAPHRWRGRRDVPTLHLDDVSGIPFLVGLPGVEEYRDGLHGPLHRVQRALGRDQHPDASGRPCRPRSAASISRAGGRFSEARRGILRRTWPPRSATASSTTGPATAGISSTTSVRFSGSASWPSSRWAAPRRKPTRRCNMICRSVLASTRLLRRLTGQVSQVSIDLFSLSRRQRPFTESGPRVAGL